ncbi:MAG: H-type lectin domain-containing protein [Magnetococcus sp. DMHC-6]
MIRFVFGLSLFVGIGCLIVWLYLSKQERGIHPDQIDLSNRVTQLEVENRTLQANLGRLEGLEEKLNQLQNTIFVKKDDNFESRMGDLEKNQFRLLNGQVSVQRGDLQWKLEDIFSKRRVYQTHVSFPEPFPSPPSLVLGLTQLEMGENAMGLKVQANDIDAKGFNLIFATQSDNRVRNAAVDWLAFWPNKTVPTEPMPTVQGTVEIAK